MTDPLETVWAALEAAECGPWGRPNDFRSACPGHGGSNCSALHIREGVDRRVLIHCFSGCHAEEVVRALGLQWRDLFPEGHRHNRRRPRPRRHKRAELELVLDGLELLGIPFYGHWNAQRCPYCEQGELEIWLDALNRPTLTCRGEECHPDDVLGALKTRVAEKEADGQATV